MGQYTTNRFVISTHKFKRSAEQAGCYSKWSIKDTSNNSVSLAIFGVPELKCSIYTQEIQERAEEVLDDFLKRIDSDQNLDSVYWFEFLGDHFEFQTSIPKWAKLY